MSEKKDLLKAKKLIFAQSSENDTQEITQYNERYMQFLDRAKTERLFCSEAVKEAEAAGFRPLDQMHSLKPGDKVYQSVYKKALVLFIIGSQPFSEGLNIVGSHIDSPRLDLKPLPLYESDDLAFLKTHYYGGIKKYQWVTLPLALYGTVVFKDGSSVDIAIGDKPEDPVFCVTDLLIHLANEQMGKKASEVIEGENLNLLVGSIPVQDSEVKEAVKQKILEILHERYGMIEEDFESAEFEAVPAGAARSVGFDSGLLGAYAQDDRVCAFAALDGILKISDVPKRTACVILADKEEIGSYGNTGMQSRLFENAAAEISALLSEKTPELTLRRALAHSAALSGDVTAGYDPAYASAFDAKNSAYLGKGVVLSKYGGARGKSGSNDASAEFMASLRRCFDEAGAVWQTGELGKVDQGGGGTIAYMLANYGMDIVDCGTAVLSMHSPFEVTSKADTFMTFKAYHAFLAGFAQ